MIPPVAVIPSAPGGALVPPPPAPKVCLKYSKRCPSAFVVVG
jgi:hypothetical protein